MVEGFQPENALSQEVVRLAGSVDGMVQPDFQAVRQ
jgi:hypothetical protein